MTGARPTATGALPVVDVDAALDRARALAAEGERRVLGITGAPGAGKSTLAEAVVAAVGKAAVLVPMDGFHLAQAALEERGRAERKGAPDTFDAGGFVALLRRLRPNGSTPTGSAPSGPAPGSEDVHAEDGTVWAPLFQREIEEPIAGAVPVRADVPLVVVEGNYLLLDDGPWAAVAGLLDEVWFVEVEEPVRIARLVARHERYGKEPGAARAWARGPDQRNADLVARTRPRADVVVRG